MNSGSAVTDKLEKNFGPKFALFLFLVRPTLVRPLRTRKKFAGLRPANFFLRFFFWFGRSWFGRSVGENLGRWRKSRTFAKISAVRENLGRWRKSRTLSKISDVGKNLGRRRKSRPSAKISAIWPFDRGNSYKLQ